MASHSYVLVYHDPLLSHLLGVAPSTFTTVYQLPNVQALVVSPLKITTFGSPDGWTFPNLFFWVETFFRRKVIEHCDIYVCIVWPLQISNMVSWPPFHPGFKGNRGKTASLLSRDIFGTAIRETVVFVFIARCIPQYSHLLNTSQLVIQAVTLLGWWVHVTLLGWFLVTSNEGIKRSRMEPGTGDFWNIFFFWWVLLNWWFQKQNQQFLRVFFVGFEDLLRYTGWAGAAILRDGRFFGNNERWASDDIGKVKYPPVN